MRFPHTLALFIFLAAKAAAVLAGENPERLTPSEIGSLPRATNGGGTSGVSTMRTSVLSGDPAEPGLYTIQIVVPPHTVIGAHSHRDDRVATVVSGIWYIGYGLKRDSNGLKRLSAGSFYTEPASKPHFAGTRDTPAVIRITGYGPTDTVYVDAADDPAKIGQGGK
jgi:quercetin dioxygenase-like cupin family protein